MDQDERVRHTGRLHTSSLVTACRCAVDIANSIAKEGRAKPHGSHHTATPFSKNTTTISHHQLSTKSQPWWWKSEAEEDGKVE
jgi:hypothetical protein